MRIQTLDEAKKETAQNIQDVYNFFTNIKSGLTDFWNNISGRTSKEIAEKNFNMQQEQFDYQKQLNELMMEREDTAYQRAVTDARAAGLSALSVNGGSSSAAGTSAPAPQINDYAQNQYTNGLNLLNSLTQFENNLQQQIINKKRAEAEINKTNAETRDIEAKTDLFTYQLPYLKIFTDYDYTDRTNKNNFFKAFGGFSGANPYQEYSILKNLSTNQYANVIRTNEFDKIGMLFSIIQDLGKKFGINKMSDVEDTLNKMPKIFNGFDDINLSNNQLNIPSSIKSIFKTATQNAINNVNTDYKKNVSNYVITNNKEALNVADYYTKNIASKIGMTVKSVKDKNGKFYFEVYRGKQLLNTDQHFYTRQALGQFLQKAYDDYSKDYSNYKYR